ncbi:MAG TPA: antibiotic biosynthesis monooxygenase, partial [Planctomycetota bacterium]|nr:antibiotic biosynthesis monooxygenase [Planctomycetota bacterium]
LSARDDYFIMLRFGNQADLERWQRSPEVLDLLAAAAPLLTSGEAGHVRTGLETWFTLPGQRPPAVAPPRWKMALVTWCALSPQVIALLVVMPSWVPLPVAAVVSTAVAVALLTWVVMPRLARLLHRWLHGERAQQ